MNFTSNRYIDSNGGLFIEYFGENGFYRYIHIDKYGKVNFLPDDAIVKGKKCDYYIDYCSSEALTTEVMLNDLRESFKSNADYYKSQVDKLENKSLEIVENDFCADDIPF